jgi:hypothetical protein
MYSNYINVLYYLKNRRYVNSLTVVTMETRSLDCLEVDDLEAMTDVIHDSKVSTTVSPTQTLIGPNGHNADNFRMLWCESCGCVSPQCLSPPYQIFQEYKAIVFQ